MLMGPRGQLLPFKNSMVKRPTDPDPWMSRLLNMVTFSESFVRRATRDWQKKFPELLNMSLEGRMPTTLSSIGNIFTVSAEDWAFVEDILKADPGERPTASELLSHSWLAL